MHAYVELNTRAYSSTSNQEFYKQNIEFYKQNRNSTSKTRILQAKHEFYKQITRFWPKTHFFTPFACRIMQFARRIVFGVF